VAFVAVNAEQAEDWNGASGREFIEQRERHERMLGPLRARLLAAAAGVGNARFEVADAQVHPFGAGTFDVVVSSLGVMFFDDPAAAFGNLRKALRRGGRLAFLCWRTREENPVFTTGFAEAAAVLVGRDVADVLEYERASPTATEILAGLSAAQAAELTRQVRDRLAAYASPDGVVMPGAAWLVTAQAV
jgi:SAM-dependent methyltransferase